MTMQSQLTEIKGIGEATARLFATIGVHDVQDLINYYPRTYNDFSDVQKIQSIKPGPITIKANIKQVTDRYVRRGMHITEAVASDDTGSIRLIWFNQPYRKQSIVAGQPYYISGQFELSHQKFAVLNPACEKESDFPVNTARILPIYRETKGLKSSLIRKSIKQISPTIDSLPETLPDWILKDQKLMSRAKAVFALHFPSSAEDLEQAKKRLGFEEVFELTLAALLNKAEHAHDHGLRIPFKQKLALDFVGHLPFTLTDDQKRVIWQIYQDFNRDQPMNRLVEGDVGSGKTVVATMAALMALEQNFQVAFMAPTELLARQHAETIYKLLKPLGYEDQVGLLVGGMKPVQKSLVQKQIKEGAVRFIIGTHALIQEKVNMERLGFIIIDEQHRFGVEQRKKLMMKTIPSSSRLKAIQGSSKKRPQAYMKYDEDASKRANEAVPQEQSEDGGSANITMTEAQELGGHMPHVLSMTATPIPRSLALTLYGELDISTIATKPADRLPIITKITSPNSVATLYESVDKQIETGRQMFVVCPLVEESTMTVGLISAEQMFTKLSKGPFKHRRVALLHGKMKPSEKNTIMEDFVAHKYDILVATTVIEVGVDVPNATVMIIQNADRFGLAQLHQLRGRVGRSSHQGYCYGVLTDSKAVSRRLRAFEDTNDGFKLAELDLELRGPGAIYGTFQHGQLDLRIAKLTDTTLIASARQTAQAFIDRGESLVQYSHLAQRVTGLQAVTNLN